MNAFKTLSMTAGLVAALASTTAFADTDEYTRNLNLPQAQATATVQRADVQAAARYAVQTGDVAQNEYERNQYAEPVAPSAVLRAQVVAEAIEARKLGLIAEGDITKIPTAAQLEQVRLAGQAAVERQLAGQVSTRGL